MKIGDRVKVVGGHSPYLEKIGIYFSNRPYYDDDVNMSVAFDGGGTYTYPKRYLELVEIANYVPIPKHKKGDIRWVRIEEKWYEVIVVEERNGILKYKCYGKYDNMENNILYFTDDELLLDKPEGVKKNE